MDSSLKTVKPEEQRTDFIGRVQEQRQFLVALQGLLAHQRRWSDLAQGTEPDFDLAQAPGDGSYANIFLPHGIGGIGKSWLTQRCLTLAREMPLDPPILTLYEDVSLGAPVLEPAHLLDRLYNQLAEAGYEAHLAPYWQAKVDTPDIVSYVTRYQFENREQWDNMVQLATDLIARRAPEPGYHSFSETSIAYSHLSGTEAVGKDAATLARAYDLLLEQMQQQDKLKPAEAALFRNPPAAQAAYLVTALKRIVGERPLVIALDNLEIIVSLEPIIRDCLVLPTNQAPIIWILSSRHSLADERVVEINGQPQAYKGYRDLLGENPPVVWDMSIFGDADLRDYLQAEAERRRAPLIIDEEVIEAVKSTSSGVPLVVEMVADAFFTMERDEFLQDFALDDQSLLASDRLDKITERFLRHCLTNPDDLERVQAMALLRKGVDEEALAAVWQLQMDQPARNMLHLLRARYAFVLPDGLHDAVYEFVRRQLRTSWQHSEARERLGLRAVAHYRSKWEVLDQSFADPALRVRDPGWQQATRDLVNGLLWSDPDEAVLFLLPRFVEGLGFDRPFANGLLIQAEEFLIGSVAAFSTTYANLLHRMRVGMQDIDWFFEEPGEAMGAMVESLLQAPGLDPLHISILHLWQGNWLVESGQHDQGLAAYLQADQYRPEDAVGLGRQLSKAFYELSSIYFWPESATETIASDAGLQAARQAAKLNPEDGRAWFNVGVGLDYLGREAESLAAYKRAIEIDPQPSYYNNLGNVYSALGHDDEAISAYEQAIELEPANAWPYHSLGQIYADQGNYEQALDFYQQAIDRHHSDEDRAVSWDEFGGIQAVLGNNEAAISAYQRAANLNPEYASPWYGLGKVYGASGRVREAIDAYRRTVELDRTRAQAYHNLGDIYVRQGEYEEAFTQYQQAVARHEDNRSRALALNGLGNVYVALEQYADASRSYRQALDLDPEQAQSWNDIGDVHRLTEDVGAAIEAYRQAVTLDPEYTAAWNSLGHLYGALEQDDEAIRAYLQVIALEPDLAWPYNSLGYIYSRRGEYQRAISLYRQSIERHEDDKSRAMSWSDLGDAQVAQGHEQQAIEAYSRSTSLDPNYAWPFHKLGQVYEDQGAHDLACTYYLRAIERHTQAEDLATSWRRLARVYRISERYGQATGAYEKIIELAPEDVRSWNNLGDVHLAMARYQEATQAFQEAINLDPDYAWPYHNLGLISTDYGTHESALTLYQQAIERHKDDEARAISWNKVGDTYLALEKPVEASGAYQQAIEVFPDYAWPYHGLGTIHQARGESRTALDFFQQAIKRYPATEKKSLALAWNGAGTMYKALDRFDEAINAYGQASQLDSILAAPWHGLGDIYSTLTKYDQAISSYERAIELDSTLARPYHRLGLIYETRGDYEPAVVYFQQAIERYSPEQAQGQARSWHHLGNVYRALNRTGLAIEAYQRATEFDEEYVAPWHSLGDVYRDLERYSDAIQAYQQTVKLDPTVARPWNSLGDIYRSQNHYEQAIEVYQRAIEREPDYAWPYHNLGLIDEHFEKYESAIKFYEQALKRYPQVETKARALSWSGLGNVYSAQGRDPQAIEAYRQVIELFPDYAWSYHRLGSIYARRGQQESAIIFYQQAIDRQLEAGKRAVVWNDLGNAYGGIRRWNDAIDAYRQAIDLDSQYARPWFNLGNVYTEISDYDAARQAYQRSIELDATYAWSYNNLGLICKQLGEYSLAIGLYQQAVERHTNDRHKAISWNNLGDVYHNQEQYEQALNAYQQALELDPGYAYPWNGLADVYRARGRTEGVVEAYQKAIEFEPNFADPYHSLGQIYKDEGAYGQAITYFRQAIARYQRAKDRAMSWHGLGDVYRALQSYDQAIDSYQKSIALDPDEAWAYHNLAFVYKDLGTYQGAITLYQQAIERFEDSYRQAVSWNNLGNIYSILEQSNQAIEAYQQAITLDDTYALPWNSLGEIYNRLKRPKPAVDAYQQAIQRDPEYVLAWNNLGDVYRSLSRYEEAVRAYKRAIELDPTFAWPYHSLGLIYEERGELEAAIIYYQQAVERHQSDEQKAVLWDNLGGIYRVMGEGAKAIEAYHRATRHDPTYAAPWYSLGNIYAALDRDEEAINAYRRSIEVRPVDPWPYHNLALVYEKIHRYDEAVSLYQQAIERHIIDRNRAVSWDSLGNVYSDAGRYQEAVYAFQEALRLNPDYALPWNSLGDVYNALEDYSKAIEAYEKAIELDPTYAWPYNNLGLVYESLRQYDLAISILKEVIKIHASDRDRAVSWNSLGDIYETLKRESEAISAYEAAISLDPDFTWPYNSLGTIYERRGQHDQADALYQQATRRYRKRSLV